MVWQLGETGYSELGSTTILAADPPGTGLFVAVSTEQVYIYDLSDNLVFDPEDTLSTVTDISWSTMWAKGYGPASFTIRRRDLLKTWAIKESFGVIIRDGQRIVYQGRIEKINLSVSGLDERVDVQTVGWWVVLEERLIHKRWVDNAPVQHLAWPPSLLQNSIQNSFGTVRRDDWLEVKFGQGDYAYTANDAYRELYKLPSGTIRRITLDWKGRTGEGITFGTETEAFVTILPLKLIDVVSVGGTTGTVDNTYSSPYFYQTLVFCIRAGTTDIYDENDYLVLSNWVIYANYHASHPNYASPSYTAGELIKDVLLLVNDGGAALSADFDDIGEPATTLNPYTVEVPTPAGDVVQEIAKYGDSSLRSWGLCVWDETGTSDGLPKCEFTYRDTSDYKYILSVNDVELRQFNTNRNGDQLYNDIVVEYTDKDGRLQWLTSADDANLKNQDSIDNEYKRQKKISIGKADATTAAGFGKRYLEFHKNRLRQGTFSAVGVIQTKDGQWMPVSRVRAGDTVYVPELDEVFFIRHTGYNAESKLLQISPDLPDDNLSMQLARMNKAIF